MRILLILIPIFVIGIFPAFGDPFVLDRNYIVELVVSGLKQPTTMTFVGEDILVLEKKNGDVRLVRNGTLIEKPILHVDVNSENERGLLGITSVGSEIYLYYTASKGHQGEPIGNQIHKFTWDGESLINDILIHQVPTDLKEHSQHNGGAMTVDNEGMVYVTVGDARKQGIFQNYENGDLEDTGIILKVNVNESILEPSKSENPQENYQAIGIRNSFGIGVDPFTGFLWDTENGPDKFDEVNLVEPNFNSGWAKIMGPASPSKIQNLPSFYEFKYSDPEFSWEHTVAPTAITFVDSKLFKNYKNHVFVGAFSSGTLYKFSLNEERTGFIFKDPSLDDLVLNFDDSDLEISFGRGFSGITDLEFSPDGSLYVLSILDGKIHKIHPSNLKESQEKIRIPEWTKKLFSWWHDEKIDDISLLNNLEYLINKNIIVLNDLPEYSEQIESIPLIFEENSLLWAKEKLPEESFANSIMNLVRNDVISVDSHKIKCNSKPKIMSDFSECDFSGIVFSKIDLSNTNMSKISLNSAIFNETNLSLVDLSNSHLTNAIFESVNLQGGNFYHSIMNDAKFINSDLSWGDFKKTTSINANFSKSKLHDTNFDNSILTESDFTDSSLFRARFNNADLNKVSFVNTKLHKALFLNSSVEGANFEGSDLRAIRAINSNFENSNLSNSDLKNINLENSNFKNSNFQGSDLTSAKITNSNLEGANFQNTILLKVKFIGTNLNGVNFSGADLSKANLLKSHLGNANFTGAKIDGCLGCPLFP